MLSAHSAPKEIVIGEGFPGFGYLGCAPEGEGIEVAEDAEIYFSGEEGEGVDTDEEVERVGYMG